MRRAARDAERRADLYLRTGSKDHIMRVPLRESIPDYGRLGNMAKQAEANKKMPASKNKRNSSTALAASMARVIASKKDADDLRLALESLVADSGKHSIGSWEEVEKRLTSGDASSNSVFLGNGFNIAIGVKTDYKSLGQALLGHASVKESLKKNAPKIFDSIDKQPEQIERLISDGLDDHSCQQFIKDIFYGKILQRCSISPREQVLDFLGLFNNFFTTNYDPLLYLFLLKIKKRKLIDDNTPYYRKVVQINMGEVTIPKTEDFGENSVPLKDMTHNLRYELSKYMMSEGEVAGKGRNNFYAALRHMEKKRSEIEFDDGFRFPAGDKKADYMLWEEPSERKGHCKDNVFYLHGGLFIYKEQEEVRKTISRGQVGFVKYIASLGISWPLCVFEARDTDKKTEIDDNKYLSNCLKKLGEASGNLCIVGWRCNENDQHLAECINKNNRIDTLLVAYYRGAAKVTVEKYTEEFPDKEIIFWDVGEAPFDINKIKEEEKIKKLEIAADIKA